MPVEGSSTGSGGRQPARTLTVKTPRLHGDDVRHLQTLLGVKPDGVYGPSTATAVYQAKLHLGYPSPDHAAGTVLVAYLAGTKKPTVAMVKRAAGRAHAKPDVPGHTSKTPLRVDTAAVRDAHMRAQAVLVMHLMLSAEPREHYAQIRPMHTVQTIRTLADLEAALKTSVTFDCSESSTLIARLAGARDPNGPKYNYDGEGFTGTIKTGSPAISFAEARPGDFVEFGPGTCHHVCVILATGRDPLLFSMGQEKGPSALPLSVEARFQPAPIIVRQMVAE